MSKLCFEMLDPERLVVFERLGEFGSGGVLGGGTALALQIGHRRSYDFDVFTPAPVEKGVLLQAQAVFGEGFEVLVDSEDELSFLTPGKIKVTLLHFPFPPLHPVVKTKNLPLFSVADLASNKAYSIGRRGEYRDYVDLFFVIRKGIKLEKIIAEAQKRFAGAFSEKLFLEQLTYFGDLDDFSISFVGESFTPEKILDFFKDRVVDYTKSKI